MFPKIYPFPSKSPTTREDSFYKNTALIIKTPIINDIVKESP